MIYTKEDHEKDLIDPEFSHIKDRERFIGFYNELGKKTEQKKQGFNEDTEKRMKFVIPKGKILELGCHWGFNLIHWARLGFECVGVDCSKTLLDFGKEKIALEPEYIRNMIGLVNCLIEDFDPICKYDTIVLTETLEHVIDPLPVLMKAKECLAVNGYLYISAPEIRCGNASHVRGINISEMMSLLAKVGLIVEYGIWGMAYITDDGSKIPITMVVAKHPKHD